MEEVPLKDQGLTLFIQQSYINFLSWSIFYLALVHQVPYGSKRISPLIGEVALEFSDSSSQNYWSVWTVEKIMEVFQIFILFTYRYVSSFWM